MARAVEVLERDLQGIRTGRASTSLVERIHVDYYGTQTPLNQLAGISVPEPHQIVIQPWDRSVLGAIERAITKSDIGLTPNVDGTVVRLNIPALTEERRHDLVRQVHKRMEEARVEIRNLRRDAADHLKKLQKDGEVGADEERRSWRPSRRRPTATSARSTASARPRSRRSSRSSGACAADPSDGRPASRARDRGARRRYQPLRTLAAASPDAADDDLPRHVAIIMDGNRRWARARGVSEIDGHAAGVEAIRELLRHAVRRGIPVLTLYAFSRENWARTDEEVVGLFELLEQAIRSETAELRAQGVQVRLLGRLDELPKATRASIESALDATAGGTRMRLNIAFNYAGRTELVDAVRPDRPRGRSTPSRSTRPRSRAPSTPPGCPTPTS